jgi:hypothetical protein
MLSACPFRDLANAVSVLYDRDPEISHRDDTVAALQVARRWHDMQARAGLQAAQVWTESLNECGRMLHVDPDSGRMGLRIVTPDLLDGRSHPARPGKPVEIREWCYRKVAGEWQWVQEVWNVEDELAPYFVVLTADGDDITGQVEGVVEGWPDVYRWEDGRPWLPWSITHSVADPPSLFSPWHRIEAVDGTMVAARNSALIDHSQAHAAWPQRCVANMQPAGMQTQEATNGQPVSVVVSDPTSIIAWQPIEDGIQPMQWQWSTAAPIGEMQDVYERRLSMLAQSWGLSPSDLVRQSDDPRSGVALSLSRAGVREVQMRRAPVYRPHDERLAAMTAAAMNRLDGGTRPENGYRVAYALLPLSVGEQAQIERETLALLDRGLLSPAEARARILGESLQNASVALTAMRTGDTDQSAKASLNGAQITALVEIAARASAGELAPNAARLIAAASFPTVPSQTIDQIFADIASAPPSTEEA